MKLLATYLALVSIPAVPSCGSTSERAQHSEPSTTPETIRARNIEILDHADRVCIRIGKQGGVGPSCIEFLDAEGERVWSATYYDQVRDAKAEMIPGGVFVIQGELGDPLAVYNLWVSSRGCALHMGADQDDDEGGIGIGHYDGKSFLTLSASKAEEGGPEEVGVQLELLGNRVVVSDINNKEITSFPAPAAIPNTPQPMSAGRAAVRPISPPPK